MASTTLSKSNMPNQLIKIPLLPEIGLTLDPEQVEQIYVSEEFSRTLSHLVGLSGSRGAMIKATSSGSLHVATTGSGLEIYQVQSGGAADSYAAADTFAFTSADEQFKILIENNEAQISLRNSALTWGGNINLTVGWHTFDFVIWGIRIQNRYAGLVSDYYYTGLR